MTPGFACTLTAFAFAVQERKLYPRTVRGMHDTCMKRRTYIKLEEVYVEAIMRRYRLRTKTEAVNLALRWLAGQPMTREEALAMGGAGATFEADEAASR